MYKPLSIISLLLCFAALNLVSATAIAEAPSPKSTPIEQARKYEKQRNYQQAADMYLIVARTMTPPAGEAWRVKAAEMAWLTGNLAQAESILQSTDQSTLNPTMLARLRIIGARIARYNRNYPEVTRLLAIPLDGIPTMSRKQIESLQAEAQRKAGSINVSRSSVTLNRASTPQAAVPEDARWQSLLQMPAEALAAHINQTRTPIDRGWAELAYIAKTTSGSLRYEALNRWQALYSDHPAMRGYFQQLQEAEQGPSFAAAEVGKITVLLPTSGKLANLAAVIIEGITQAAVDNGNPAIKYLDSNEADITSLYRSAVAGGANIIIGPMDKPQVDQLTQAQLSVPVVSLNYGNRVDLYNPYLFQYALLPEDEAHEAAERIASEGHKTVGVIVPKSSWGDRLAQAFRQKAETLGLDIKVESEYLSNNSNTSSVIKNGFDVKEDKVGNEVDAIFLVATPRQARLVKPLLKFHFLGHVPVYATSHVFAGESNGSDSDLNGIRFTEIPWLLELNADAPKKSSLSDTAQHYPRMFAFGYDAATIAIKLATHGNASATKIDGLSGSLYPDSRNRIHRKVGWSRFVRGTPQTDRLPSKQ